MRSAFLQKKGAIRFEINFRQSQVKIGSAIDARSATARISSFE
jgi:hypothetical protein